VRNGHGGLQKLTSRESKKASAPQPQKFQPTGIALGQREKAEVYAGD